MTDHQPETVPGDGATALRSAGSAASEQAPIPGRTLAAAPRKMVLVVCTGNICRSPIAQAWLASQLHGAADVQSAGTSALVGSPADPSAVQVCRDAGLDLASHRARQITPELLRAANLVLVMESGHRDHLCRIAPWATGKIWRWGHHAGTDIADPYKQGLDKFQIALETIVRLGKTWVPLVERS